MRAVNLAGVVLASVAATAIPKYARSAERTGWENIPAGEMAVACRVQLSETRPVLHGQNRAVFEVPMASEAIRLPPALRKAPIWTPASTDAERTVYMNWSQAVAAFIRPREQRFKELLAKSRPEPGAFQDPECKLVTFEMAGKWSHGSGYNSRPPFLIGTEFRDIYKPEDMSRPVWGKVYRADFLPPDWTKGLPDAVIANADLTPKSPAPTPKPTPSAGGSLTIKQDTSAADARRAWDAQVAKALKQEAEQKAAILAKTTQADAKLQADVEKARQERVKRGRAQ